MNTAGAIPTLNPLHTNDPVALRYLMSETIFDIEDGTESAVANSTAAADAISVSVAVPESAPDVVQEENKSLDLTYLGKNQSGFLFVVMDKNRPDQHRLPMTEMEAFEKTLGALQLNLDHVALFNLASITLDQVTFADVLAFFDPQKVIFLGTRIQVAGLGKVGPMLNPHQVIRYEKTEFLLTFSFSEMMNDTDKKRLFWTNLKAMLTI